MKRACEGCETCEQAFLLLRSCTFTAFTGSQFQNLMSVQKSRKTYPHQSDDQNSENEAVKPVKLLCAEHAIANWIAKNG